MFIKTVPDASEGSMIVPNASDGYLIVSDASDSFTIISMDYRLLRGDI